MEQFKFSIQIENKMKRYARGKFVIGSYKVNRKVISAATIKGFENRDISFAVM
jgi:hypothetical protein